MSEDLAMLSEAVYDADGRQIAPAGALVARNLLAAVSGTGSGSGSVQFADCDLAADFENVLGDPDLVDFYGGAMRSKISGIVGRVTLPLAVQRELAVMRSDFPILYVHTLATTAISVRLAMEVVIKADDLARIARAVLVKDLGMTRVAQPVVRNRDYLTKQEFHQIRKHPVIGLLINTYYFGEGMEGLVALRHHMRNGAGYPAWGGLKPSRLVDIVEATDVFYALISPRPFRPVPFDPRGALDEMTAMIHKGELSEEAVKLMVACLRADRPQLRQVDLSAERLGFAPGDNFYGTGPQ